MMDVLEAIKTRRSVRAYSSREIPAKKLDRLRQAIRYAPSACNLQPWRFVFVKSASLRRQVAQAALDQMWMAQAPIIVAACGIPRVAYKTMGGYGNSAEIDVTIALDHLTLAAVAEGLGTCWVGAFDEKKIKSLLDVPRHAKVVALVPVGYPASPDANSPIKDGDRRKAAEVFRVDRYGRP
jgi:nitroreductase